MTNPDKLKLFAFGVFMGWITTMSIYWTVQAIDFIMK